MKHNAIFITGTDTNVGKTFVTLLLMKKLQSLGYLVQGIKPVASGCIRNDDGLLVNEDALRLQHTSSHFYSYPMINPIAYQDSIAPHIAAQRASQLLTKQSLIDAIERSLKLDAGLYLIEGCGGWTIPLNLHERYSQVIVAMKLPVMVVIGMRLGCLNHALLTMDHLTQSHTPVLGWVANVIDPTFEALDENIQTLQHCIKSPLLATVPYHSCSNDLEINWNLESIFKNISIAVKDVTNRVDIE